MCQDGSYLWLYQSEDILLYFLRLNSAEGSIELKFFFSS